MTKEIRAPYGNGYYVIGYRNGKHFAEIYDDRYDENPEVLIADTYGGLCEKLADVWF